MLHMISNFAPHDKIDCNMEQFVNGALANAFCRPEPIFSRKHTEAIMKMLPTPAKMTRRITAVVFNHNSESKVATPSHFSSEDLFI